MSTGARVLKTLSKQGKTMSELANYLGTAPSTINGWKKENRNPSSEIIIPICEFLNISVMYILTGETQYEDIPFEKTVNSSNLLSDKIDKLSERGQAIIDELVEFLLYKEEMKDKEQNNIVPISKVTKETSVNTDDTLEVSIPMKGYIAAGQPITLPDDENTFIDDVVIKNSLLAEKADFSLQVKGDSMYPLINDGDIVFVKIQPFAEDGQIVVASINNATTLKKLQRYPDRIELHAINPKYPPIIIDNECIDFRILGVKL